MLAVSSPVAGPARDGRARLIGGAGGPL